MSSTMQSLSVTAPRASGLCLDLRPGGVLLLNGGIQRFPRGGKVLLDKLGHNRFVHGKHYMEEGEAKTPLRRAYFLLQQYYAGWVEERGERLRELCALVPTLPTQAAREIAEVLASPTTPPPPYHRTLQRLRLMVVSESSPAPA